MTVKDELLAIQQADEEHVLRAEAAWRWAKAHPRSALYRQIEWNVSRAAKEYQIWQIRRLIMIHVTVADGTPQIVSLSIDRVLPGGGYRSVSDVLQSRELSEIMLADALADLERIRLRYARVKELTSVWAAVDKVRARKRAKSVARKRA